MKDTQNNITFAPIILFVYRRLDHAMEAINALKANPEAASSKLIVFSDGGKDDASWENVKQVREYLRGIDGFAEIEIVEREINWGIEKSEIEGISSVVNQYGKVIVIEDDIVVSKHFLKYVNDALIKYESSERVGSVTGYSFISTEECVGLPEYSFTQLTSAWGWATWKDRWNCLERQIDKDDISKLLNPRTRKAFDHGFTYTQMLANQYMNGHITWDVLWYWTSFSHNWLTLFPTKSMVNNIGMDGSGEHYTDTTQSNRIENIDAVRVMDLPDRIGESDEVKRKITSQLVKLANASPSRLGRMLTDLRTLRRLWRCYRQK